MPHDEGERDRPLMHQQIRVALRLQQEGVARRGALADLADTLANAKPKPINIWGVNGAQIELGGFLHFFVADEDHERAMEVLKRYSPEEIDVEHHQLENEPGELARLARTIANEGKVIDTLVIGAQRPDGKYDVQLTTQPAEDVS